MAWVIATHLFRHHQPFFAPIAAASALNISRGERGSNAVRLLQGVIVGIVVAQLATGTVGAGDLTVAVATFVAMFVSLMLGGTRVVIGQAAASAILTTTTGSPDVGAGRLADALVGAGVALVFTQLLFPAEPVTLLRRAETAVLTDISHALDLAGQALEHHDDELAGQAIAQLRNVRDRMSELGRTRDSSERAAKRSPMWWGRRASPIVRENENAGQLDLLGTSCLMLTRAVLDTDQVSREQVAPAVRGLGQVLGRLAKAPGDREARQRAADDALEAAGRLGDEPDDANPALVTARATVRLVASDTMVFAGVDPTEAAAAIKQGSGEMKVPDPPSGLPIHLGRLARRLRRRFHRRRRSRHEPQQR
jgi:uncharacterized membrane protein YccC